MPTTPALFRSLTVLLVLASCNTSTCYDLDGCFRKWTGQDVPAEVEVLNAQYWRSAHWSLEYIAYFELKASAEWRKDFIQKLQFVQTKEKRVEPSPDGDPDWLVPPPSSTRWVPEESTFSQGTTVFDDSVGGRLFVYDIQL